MNQIGLAGCVVPRRVLGRDVVVPDGAHGRCRCGVDEGEEQQAERIHHLLHSNHSLTGRPTTLDSANTSSWRGGRVAEGGGLLSRPRYAGPILFQSFCAQAWGYWRELTSMDRQSNGRVLVAVTTVGRWPFGANARRSGSTAASGASSGPRSTR